MVDVAAIFIVLRHINSQRGNHSAGALAWSHDCAQRAQYLVNVEIAYPGSVTSDMMSANGLTCFGQNIAVGVEATSPAGACVGAIDIWQVGQGLVDESRKQLVFIISFYYGRVLGTLLHS